MKIAEGLYGKRLRLLLEAEQERWDREGRMKTYADGTGRLDPPPSTGTELMIRTEGQRWFTDQVEQGRRDGQHQSRRHGWGLCGRFPSDAWEVE